MRTRVIHKRSEEFYDPADLVYIGRPSIFGNPFKIGRDGDREDVCSKYDSHFAERIQTDPEFVKAVLALKGKILVCFCKPEMCHGDTIAAWVDEHDPMFDEALAAWEKSQAFDALKDKLDIKWDDKDKGEEKQNGNESKPNGG
jgi:hypothetical protein